MKNTDQIAVKVTNVSKSFKLPHEKNNSIKSTVINPFRKRTFEKQEALKNIEFEIKKGEFFGIVGRNGSGKSTLLKLLAGIYSPNEGHIQINGKLTPFIELGVGFNPELTGRENVFLNGALLGFNRKEMTGMYDEIVDFAELEKFMDQKLKNYSSGMQVRLAFSIAIRAESDILVLDEVLAVGDANFQQKCYDYFAELKKKKKTVILVSHDRNALEKYCDRGVLIHNGRKVFIGSIDKVLSEYNNIVLEGINENLEHKEILVQKNKFREVEILDIATSEKDKITDKFSYGSTITVSFKARFHENISDPIFGITVWDYESDKPVLATNTYIEKVNTGDFNKDSCVSFRVNLPKTLNDSKFFYEVAVANKTGTVVLAQSDKKEFRIVGSRNPYSSFSFEDKITLRGSK